MGLETGTHINNLIITNPTDADDVRDGYAHLQLLKTTIKNTFPQITGAVTKSHTQINNAVTDVANAASANTASQLVARDGSGNFAAGTITAALTGNVTGNVTGNLIGNVAGNVIGNVQGNISGTAGSLANSQTIQLTGDVTGSATFNGTSTASITATVTDDSHNHTIANVDGLQTALDAKLENILNLSYPVGSIYITVDPLFNPETTFGGNWSPFGAGRVLVGLDSADADFDTCEEMSGYKTHTLTEAQMPSHTHVHTVKTGRSFSSSTGSAPIVQGSSQAELNDSADETTSSTGGGQPHNNLQPYIVVQMWKRDPD